MSTFEVVGTSAQNRMSSALESAIRRIYELDAGQGGKGGFFRLFHLRDPAEGLASLISVMPPRRIGGNANRDKDTKYQVLSYEKATRLAFHAPDGHVSSAQSAIPERGRYQGAVLLKARLPGVNGGHEATYIASVSGFAVHFDEQLAVVALLSERASLEDAQAIMAASGNRLDLWPPV